MPRPRSMPSGKVSRRARLRNAVVLSVFVFLIVSSMTLVPAASRDGEFLTVRCDSLDRSVEVYTEIHGSGMPILMIHGFGPDHRLMKGCFEPVFSEIPGYRRIYFDLPGMGRTSAPDWIENTDDMLGVVVAVIDALIPEGPFLLTGESYGGLLARGLLHRMPERIDGLLLLCPLIIADHEKRDVPEHRVILREGGLIDSLPDEDREFFESFAVVQTGETWDRSKEEILPALREADESFPARIQTSGYGLSFAVDPLPKPFGKPTLFLLGRQDSMVGYRDAWDILDDYPRASFIVLDAAGHNLQIEQPALFRSHVEDWLRRVQESERPE